MTLPTTPVVRSHLFEAALELDELGVLTPRYLAATTNFDMTQLRLLNREVEESLASLESKESARVLMANELLRAKIAEVEADYSRKFKTITTSIAAERDRWIAHLDAEADEGVSTADRKPLIDLERQVRALQAMRRRDLLVLEEQLPQIAASPDEVEHERAELQQLLTIIRDARILTAERVLESRMDQPPIDIQGADHATL